MECETDASRSLLTCACRVHFSLLGDLSPRARPPHTFVSVPLCLYCDRGSRQDEERLPREEQRCGSSGLTGQSDADSIRADEVATVRAFPRRATIGSLMYRACHLVRQTIRGARSAAYAVPSSLAWQPQRRCRDATFSVGGSSDVTTAGSS